MKSFIALICIITIALNTALAGVGTIIICQHVEGNSHLVTDEAHEEADHGECCHHEIGAAADTTQSEEDCDDCFDTAVESNSLDDAISSIDRITVKAPQALPHLLAEPLIAQAETHLVKAFPASQGLFPANQSAFEYTETVQFRC